MAMSDAYSCSEFNCGERTHCERCAMYTVYAGDATHPQSVGIPFPIGYSLLMGKYLKSLYQWFACKLGSNLR